MRGGSEKREGKEQREREERERGRRERVKEKGQELSGEVQKFTQSQLEMSRDIMRIFVVLHHLGGRGECLSVPDFFTFIKPQIQIPMTDGAFRLEVHCLRLSFCIQCTIKCSIVYFLLCIKKIQ